MLAVMRAVPAVFGIVCLALTASGAPVLAAQIYPWDGKSGEVYIAVEGEIVKGDLERLQRVYASVRGSSNPGQIIGFDSPGGDLSEAMAMGRWIRQIKLKTGVFPGDSCASACVYAFAGGVDKGPLGRVLIHRPFLTTLPIEGADAALKSALVASRAYFAEMNIPESLADMMFAIAPTEAKRMTWAELEKYRLVGEDIAENEERVLNLVQKLGISRLEFNRRLQAYQRSPELAHCFTLQSAASLECSKQAAIRYGIQP